MKNKKTTRQQVTPVQEHIIVETVKSAWPRTIQGVMLFGSRVCGDERTDSDIDLAVLLTEPADPLTVWETAQLSICVALLPSCKKKLSAPVSGCIRPMLSPATCSRCM